MREIETTRTDDGTYCLRHPQTETNLRCGRCDDPICPRCMVTSPVGARCPNCARIGRPKVLDTSATEMGRAILAGLAVAIIGALLVNTVILLIPIGFLSAPLIVGMGFLVGEAVRIGSGNKLDKRLKYVASGIAFLGWAMAVLLAPVFNINIAIFGGTFGIIGMIVAIYVAAYRVRIPEGR